MQNEEARVLLRVLTREVRSEISKYKSIQWGNFLLNIQETHNRPSKDLWSHLSRVYKLKAQPYFVVEESESIDGLSKMATLIFRSKKAYLTPLNNLCNKIVMFLN